jgi:hypothetical protein
MTASDTAKSFAIVVGVVLVLTGVLGFIDNPIVSDPRNNPLFVTDTVHNVVHLVTGALALYIGIGMTGVARGNAMIGLGVAYGLVLLATLVSPTMFGLLPNGVNALDHVLHLVLAVAMIGVGWLARTEGPVTRRA